MQRVEAIIFDLEGTLLDSSVDISSCMNKLLEEEGRSPLSKEQIKECIVDGIMDSCQNAFEATGGFEGDIYPYVKRLIDHMRNDKASQKQIYPYVHEMLEKYKKANIKLAICTNKNEESTKKQLEELELIAFFDFIAGGNTFMTHKPNPDHVNGVLEKLNVSNDKAIFVGDGMGDLLACDGANVPCVIITHSKNNSQKNEMAIAQISEFDELDNIIRFE